MITAKHFISAGAILGLCLFAASATSRAFDGKSNVTKNVTSADESKTQDVSLLQKKAKKSKKARKKPRGRLPNYYGRVGISEEQREKIYAIQRMHAEKIEALQKQLNELKASRDKEVEAVLTPEQLKRVNELAEEARKKRAARSKKRKKTAKTKS